MGGAVTFVKAWTGTSLPLAYFLCLTVPINTVCRLIRQAHGYAALCSLSRSIYRVIHKSLRDFEN